MAALRHFALGCCIVCTMAGMVRLFWPENALKPVINSVLVLYIITAGVQMVHGANWQALAAELRELPTAGQTAARDYSTYQTELGLAASVQAVRQVLQNSGIDATVTLENGVCRVLLTRPADRAAAEVLLAQNCGSLPYTLQSGGDAP